MAAVETNNACPDKQLADEISNYDEMVVWVSGISCGRIMRSGWALRYWLGVTLHLIYR